MNSSSKYGTRVSGSSPSDKNINGTGNYSLPRTDQHLIIAAQSGCGIAFGELWRLYSRRIYGTILGITKNAQDAEDALQNSFLSAFLALERFEGRANFYTWLTRIGINSGLAILRKRRCRPDTLRDLTSQLQEEIVLEELADLAPNPEQIFEQQQRRSDLMQAIDELPLTLRQAVQMRISGGYSTKEVASRLNISEAAAKSRLHRASSRLGSQIITRDRSKPIGA